MTRAALLTARFLLSAWFGAAALFVIIGVREIRFPGFDSAVRDQLVLLRFPAFYVCGFATLACAMLSLVLVLCWGLRRPATWSATALTAISLGLMTYDYPCVYLPLAHMVTPPGQVRPSGFQRLHRWSELVNGVELGCVLAAALMLCAIDATPRRPDSPPFAAE